MKDDKVSDPVRAGEAPVDLDAIKAKLDEEKFIWGGWHLIITALIAEVERNRESWIALAGCAFGGVLVNVLWWIAVHVR